MENTFWPSLFRWGPFLFFFFFYSCSSFYYQPTKNRYLLPKTFHFDYEENFLSTEDGHKLEYWHIYSRQKPRYLVIQFHGNGENMSSHFLSLLKLADYDFDLLTFDYRGYGKSSGNPNPKKNREDSFLVFAKALEIKKQRGLDKIIVFAQSLGGAIAMDALSHYDQQEEISLLVLDSTFSSYSLVAKNILQKNWFTYPLSFFASLIVDTSTNPDKNFHSLKIPKLVLHGKKDQIIDYSLGLRLYDELPQPKKIYTIEEGQHCDFFYRNFPLHYQELLKNL